MDTLICPKCHKPNPKSIVENDRYCTYCGTSLDRAKRESTRVENSQTTPATDQHAENKQTDRDSIMLRIIVGPIIGAGIGFISSGWLSNILVDSAHGIAYSVGVLSGSIAGLLGSVFSSLKSDKTTGGNLVVVAILAAIVTWTSLCLWVFW